MNLAELAAALREHAEWAKSNIWEVPVTMPDDLRLAARKLEELEKENEALTECYRTWRHVAMKGM